MKPLGFPKAWTISSSALGGAWRIIEGVDLSLILAVSTTVPSILLQSLCRAFTPLRIAISGTYGLRFP